MAICRHGVPDGINIDGREADVSALWDYNDEQGTAIAIRQVRHLNNMVEQGHRAVMRITPLLGFNSFNAARCTLIGVELMYMIHKS